MTQKNVAIAPAMAYNFARCDLTDDDVGDCCNKKMQVTQAENVRFMKLGGKSLHVLHAKSVFYSVTPD